MSGSSLLFPWHPGDLWSQAQLRFARIKWSWQIRLIQARAVLNTFPKPKIWNSDGSEVTIDPTKNQFWMIYKHISRQLCGPVHSYAETGRNFWLTTNFRSYLQPVSVMLLKEVYRDIYDRNTYVLKLMIDLLKNIH